MPDAPRTLLYGGLGLLAFAGGGFLLPFLRSAWRARRLRLRRATLTPQPPPPPLTEPQRRRRAGLRTAIVFSIVLLAIGTMLPGSRGWEAAVIVYGLMIVPPIAIGISLLHSGAMQVFRLRGPFFSTVVALVLGMLTALALSTDPFSRIVLFTSGAYGLLVEVIVAAGAARPRPAP